MADNNRDGIDDNIDRQPGNSSDSREYAIRFDPRSEKEYTNQLEPQNLLQARNAANQYFTEQELAREAILAAQNDVHYYYGDKFIVPPENTWAAHSQMALDNTSQLYFSPLHYRNFDKIIAEKLNIPALSDRNDPEFSKYRGLRTNLEVLRNYIIGYYLKDGTIDPGNQVYQRDLNSIATIIGDALANDKWYKRPFVKTLSFDIANTEAAGAAEIYKFLLEQQQSRSYGAVSNFIFTLKKALGFPAYDWELEGIEKTPFSEQALSAPPPRHDKLMGTAPAQEQAATPDFSTQQTKQLVEGSEKLISIAKNLRSVEMLEVPTKEESVDEARKILRWLKNLQFGDRDVQEWLERGTPAEQIANAEALSKLVMIYAGALAKAKAANPDLLLRSDVQDGSDAAGGAAIMIAEHALGLLSEKSPHYRTLETAIDAMPEAHHQRSTQSVSRLLEHMERGLSTLSGRSGHDILPQQKLIDASENVYQRAKQLRSVDTLEPPKREESVELGREILRKLRKLMSSDKSAADAIDSGRPEEKAEFASKVEEVVEIYANTLSQAALANPDILNDPRITEANDAVGNFAHTLKLMAAKEIPNSIAQAQQISADVTQMPEEWKGLHDRAVNRLLTSIEGGLEKAVGDMEAQQQEQEQDEDIAQAAIESALAQSDHSRRRRRRRRRQQKSGMGAKKAQKINRDIMADDLAANQGRFRETREEKQTAYMGLDAKDMATIRGVGGLLRGVNEQATQLPAIDVSALSPLSPDDKSATQRAIENITSSRRNNNQPRK